jgi:hypothetical protein
MTQVEAEHLLRHNRLAGLSVEAKRQYSRAMAAIVHHYRPPRSVKHAFRPGFTCLTLGTRSYVMRVKNRGVCS